MEKRTNVGEKRRETDRQWRRKVRRYEDGGEWRDGETDGGCMES